METSELLKKVRRIEIKTRGLSRNIFAGQYHSAFKGRGMAFSEVREYQYGDDIRDIDWNVSARMGTPYVKKFVEERELSVLLLVDVSASGVFGSSERSKRRTAAELAAILAFSAAHNGDKVGLLMFSDRIELYVPPKSGRSHTLRLIREMLAFEPVSKGTNIDLALRESAQLLKKRSVVFLLSDLIDSQSYEASLKILNRKHDVIAVGLLDPTDTRWPSLLPVVVEDAETGRQIRFGGGKRALRKLDEAFASARRARQEICRRARVDMVEIGSNRDVLRPMVEFFARRRRRLESRG